MKFKILTIFPDMIRAVLGESILGRAIASGAIEAEVIDIRPYSQNRHKNTDDTPYGGGAGMVMLAQPIVDAVETAMGDDFHGRRIYLYTSRSGRELLLVPGCSYRRIETKCETPNFQSHEKQPIETRGTSRAEEEITRPRGATARLRGTPAHADPS